MILNVYAIHDRLSDLFSDTFVLDARSAQRAFKWMAHKRTMMDCEDREIVQVGTWDNEKGVLTGMERPLMVYDLEKAKKEQMDEEEG